MGERYQVPVPHASEGRTDDTPSTPSRSRTRSEDAALARKWKEEDPIRFAGTRGIRLQRDQQAVERAKEEAERKVAYEAHVKAEKIRMAKVWAEVKRRDQEEADREAAAAHQRHEDRILRAKEHENRRRAYAGLPPLP